MMTPRPEDLSGFPWEVASVASRDLLTELHELRHRLDDIERQVRNARMQDALDLSNAELLAEYPEVFLSDVDADNFDAAEESYTFWTLTRDFSLIRRLQGAADTMLNLAQKLYDSQPKDLR